MNLRLKNEKRREEGKKRDDEKGKKRRQSKGQAGRSRTNLMRPRARAKGGRSGDCRHRGLLEARSSFLCGSQALDLNRILRKVETICGWASPGGEGIYG